MDRFMKCENPQREEFGRLLQLNCHDKLSFLVRSIFEVHIYDQLV